jgi:CDP-diacylglycerol--glycerol-3-phosphate 3-phosphatidyltransferase
VTAFHVLLAVLAVLVASMASYAALGRRSDPDATRKGSQFLLGTLDFLVHWFMWLISPLERLFLRLGFTPDVFNYAGLALGLLSGVLIAGGELELGGWAIAAGGVCDIFDGRIARARGVASPYGKFIDSTFDRFVEVFAFLGFVVYLRGTPWGAFLAAGAMAGSLLVSYAQARGETVNVSGSGGLMQRAERLVLMCLVCLTDRAISSHLDRPPGTAVLWVLGFMAVATFATAAHRTVWIARRLRERGGPTRP